MRYFKYAVASVLITLMGCGALAAQENAAKAYEKLKREIEGVSKETDKYGARLKDVMQALSKVSTADAKNQAKAVKSFRNEVDGLNKALKNATDGIKSLREKRAQYFAEWQLSVATISNPDLKKAGEERRQKVMADHAQLTEKATALRERIDGFMKELADLNTFLGNDPTPGAVSAAKPTIEKVLVGGNSLAADVQQVASQLAGFAKGTS